MDTNNVSQISRLFVAFLLCDFCKNLKLKNTICLLCYVRITMKCCMKIHSIRKNTKFSIGCDALKSDKCNNIGFQTVYKFQTLDIDRVELHISSESDKHCCISCDTENQTNFTRAPEFRMNTNCVHDRCDYIKG